jgi:hypothetical protein
MGTESLSRPMPALKIIAEVVRLAAGCEDERHAQRPPEDPMYRADDLERYLQPRPRWDALVDFLRRLPEETVAGLYALYRLGDHSCSNAREAAARYRSSFELAMEPMHRVHGATDLAAKGSLADGLRHGLRNLGLELEVVVAHTTVDDMSKAPERDPR